MCIYISPATIHSVKANKERERKNEEIIIITK